MMNIESSLKPFGLGLVVGAFVISIVLYPGFYQSDALTQIFTSKQGPSQSKKGSDCPVCPTCKSKKASCPKCQEKTCPACPACTAAPSPEAPSPSEEKVCPECHQEPCPACPTCKSCPAATHHAQAVQPVRHRFCPEGREWELCGHKIGDHLEELRVGLGCLRLETLKADSLEQCRNFDKALSVITEPKYGYRLTYYLCAGCVKSGAKKGASFWMVGPYNPPGNGISFIRAEFERDEYKIVNFSLKPGSHVLDIGGNVGFFSVSVGHSFPGTKIVAVEAQPLNFIMLYHNLAVNGLLENVRPFNKALGKPDSSLTMTYQELNPGGSTIMSYKGGTASGDVAHHFDVQTMTFDHAVSSLLAGTPPHSNFTLKLDCEGCEYFAIDDVLAHESQVSDLRGETHDVERAGASTEQVEKVVKFFKKHDPTYHPH